MLLDGGFLGPIQYIFAGGYRLKTQVPTTPYPD
jgi:hypothetical protein